MKRFLTYPDELDEKLKVEMKKRYASSVQAVIVALLSERLAQIQKESE